MTRSAPERSEHRGPHARRDPQRRHRPRRRHAPSATPPAASPARPALILPRWIVAIVLILVVGAAGYATGLATAPDDTSNSAASRSPATPNRPATPTPSTTNPPNTPANQA